MNETTNSNTERETTMNTTKTNRIPTTKTTRRASFGRTRKAFPKTVSGRSVVPMDDGDAEILITNLDRISDLARDLASAMRESRFREDHVEDYLEGLDADKVVAWLERVASDGRFVKAVFEDRARDAWRDPVN